MGWENFGLALYVSAFLIGERCTLRLRRVSLVTSPPLRALGKLWKEFRKSEGTMARRGKFGVNSLIFCLPNWWKRSYSGKVKVLHTIRHTYTEAWAIDRIGSCLPTTFRGRQMSDQCREISGKAQGTRVRRGKFVVTSLSLWWPIWWKRYSIWESQEHFCISDKNIIFDFSLFFFLTNSFSSLVAQCTISLTHFDFFFFTGKFDC